MNSHLFTPMMVVLRSFLW